MSDEPKRIKQVICVRHDLKMRRGKQIAQGIPAKVGKERTSVVATSGGGKVSGYGSRSKKNK